MTPLVRRWLLALALLALPGSALAPVFALWHSPHDVIGACAISPDYENDRTLFASAHRFKVMLRSTDGGQSFVPINTGLVNAKVTLIAISPDFANDRTVFCAETAHLFRSTDAGDAWDALSLPEGMRGVTGVIMTQDGALLLSGVQGGIWRSLDAGDSWELAEQPSPALDVRKLSVSASGKRVAAITWDGRVLLSKDAGASFALLPLGAVQRPNAVLMDDASASLWVGTAAAGVFVSHDLGASWAGLNQGLEDRSVQHLALTRSVEGERVLLAATREAGVFMRRGERSWTLMPRGVRENSDQTDTHFRALHVSPQLSPEAAVFVATFQGLHRLDDGAWTHLEVLPGTLVRNLAISSQVAEDQSFWLSTYGRGVLATEDLGRSFSRIDPRGFDHPDGIAVSADGALVSGRPGALLLTTDGGATWRNRRTDKRSFPRVMAFPPAEADDGLLLAYTSVSPDNGWHGLFRSSDRGESWGAVGPDRVYVIEYAADFASSGRVWAGARRALWASDDRGLTWRAASSFPAAAVNDVTSRMVDGVEELIVVLHELRVSRVMRSLDGGQSWEACTQGLDGHYATRVAYAGDELAFLGTRSRGVLVSHDGGLSWEATGSGPRSVFSFGVSATFARDGILLVGGYQGAWVTENAGESWRLAVPEVSVEEDEDTESNVLIGAGER